jgi:16S rRNA (cytosine1402-N4)-methyltransferase
MHSAFPTTAFAAHHPMVTALGDFVARAWNNIFTPGTAERKGRRDANLPGTKDAAATPGWCVARRPDLFTAERKETLGTGLLSHLTRMGRVAPGWLSARPSCQTVESAPSDPLPHYHLSVMPGEVLAAFDTLDGKFIVDGTLGGGGHSELLLEAGARVLGIDRDPEALAHARARLARFGNRFTTHQANFSEIDCIPVLQGGDKPDGILLDLGVSSRQLDAAERGFSFMREGPLDMRMGPSAPQTASELLATIDEAELIRILREYGEEPRARRIAAAIISQREKQPITTTLDLANLIERAVGRHSRIHPATRAFQAIRIAVNHELESLETVLAAVPRVLKPGGRLAIITFHSLEDRIVKHHLRERSTPFIDQPGWPEPKPNPHLQYRLLTRKAIAPTAKETSENPRARSAKLRVAELLPPSP